MATPTVEGKGGIEWLEGAMAYLRARYTMARWVEKDGERICSGIVWRNRVDRQAYQELERLYEVLVACQ